jgi:hypothetical protein
VVGDKLFIHFKRTGIGTVGVTNNGIMAIVSVGGEPYLTEGCSVEVTTKPSKRKG